MKLTCKLALAFAVATLVAGPPAFGQAVEDDGLAPVMDAPDDIETPIVPEPDSEDDPFSDELGAFKPNDKDDCDKSCGGKGCGKGAGHRFGSGLACMCAGEPYSIWSKIAPCAEDCYNITAGGWVQIGYHTEGTNGDGTGLFNSYPNVVQLQQAWGWVEKAIDDDRCKAADWGFRMDYVYGTDGPDTQAFGGEPGQYDYGWDNGNYYGHAIPQAYLQAAYNDLTLTFGHFYTICGYEVVQAPDNFFYSHAYTMYLSEPFTHTGVLAEYSLGDAITVWGGWSAGWDTGFTRNGGDIFLGGFSVALTDSVNFTFTTTMGDFGFDYETPAGVEIAGSDQEAYSHSIVIDWAVSDKLTYVIQSDYVDNDIATSGFVRDGYDKSWGVNQYFLYQVNDCLAGGARFEYYDRDFYEVIATTVGLNIKPHANVIFRPEVRYEDFDDGNLPGLTDTFLFGMDMIVTF